MTAERLTAGRWAALILRYFMAAFFLFAAINKWQSAWMWTPQLQCVFIDRIGEIAPESFGAWFLANFGIPHYRWFAAFVTLGETAIAFGLLAGFMTRLSALGAMLMMFSFAMGGYYDASLIALGLMFLPLILLPTGRWFGLDRRLHELFPQSLLYR
jgi:thiosulfate dehydrogenase (quinone) large subunit